MLVDRLDHLVLTVRHIEATCRFYARVLGMDIVTFDNHRQALTFSSHRINLHGSRPGVRAQGPSPTPGNAPLNYPLWQLGDRLWLKSCFMT